MKLSKANVDYISRIAKRIKAINLLGGKCNKCQSDDIFILEFHHKKKNKERDISNLRGKWDKIEKEVKKCELLCRNCHFEKFFS